MFAIFVSYPVRCAITDGIIGNRTARLNGYSYHRADAAACVAATMGARDYASGGDDYYFAARTEGDPRDYTNRVGYAAPVADDFDDMPF